MADRWGKNGNSERLFFWAPESLWMVTTTTKFKTKQNKTKLAPWAESYDKLRQCMKKQRRHFADKGLSSQSYGFSSSHEWM